MRESGNKSDKSITLSLSAKVSAKSTGGEKYHINIEQLCDEISSGWDNGRRISIKIFDEGRFFMDRPVPFLVIYRKPVDRPDTGTKTLAKTEAAYLISSQSKKYREINTRLIQTLQSKSVDKFGIFLIIEIWTRYPKQPPVTIPVDDIILPGIRFYSSQADSSTDLVLNELYANLKKIRSLSHKVQIEQPENPGRFRHRPQFILGQNCSCTIQIGIEIEPYFQYPDGSKEYPLLLRSLRSFISKALRRCFYRFIIAETKQRPENFNVLGRRAVVKAVWDVDTRLTEIASLFDFILSINPRNSDKLWQEFYKSNFNKLPHMRYHPLTINVSLAKRTLFQIPIERIEDPSLSSIFLEKQEELDRQLTMLKDRGTARFLLGSLQLYGNITNSLVRLAEELLERVHSDSSKTALGRHVKYKEIEKMVSEEILYYKNIWDQVDVEIKFFQNIMSGIMVSRGNLLINPRFGTHLSRIDSLFQHEIGTHLVTYYNGLSQPLSLLWSGFASYEELQEGLAVLAEYLSGGLTGNRLRVIAARVIAAKAILDGATFIDTFRLLSRYGFAPRPAFLITLRIYRGGGFIKDCIYLRGFQTVLNFLEKGGDLNQLFIGKISLMHLTIIDELRSRKVLFPAKLVPRFLLREECINKIESLRQKREIYELVDQSE